MLPFTCAGSVAVCISDNELPPWNAFILPGGDRGAAVGYGIA